MNVELRAITVSDYAAFFGKAPDRTIRGYAFMVDGKMVGVCGALLGKDSTMLFSDLKEEIDAHPVTIWRWAKRAMDMLAEMKQPLFATTDTSEKFLNSLGFVFRGNTKYGKLYEYLG